MAKYKRGQGFQLGTTENKSSKWREWDSNPGPPDCESDARVDHSATVLAISFLNRFSLMDHSAQCCAVPLNPFDRNFLPFISFPLQGIKVFAGRCVVAVVIIHVPHFPSTTTERTRLQARQALVAALKQVLYPDLHHQHLQLNRPPPPQHHPAFPHRLLLPHRLLPQPLARELQV